MLCTWFFVRLGEHKFLTSLRTLKKTCELCLFNTGTLVRGPPSTALKILSRGVGHHLLTQHRSFSGRNPSIVNFFAFAHHLGKARTAGKLYSHVNPETSSPATYRQPVRSLSSAAPLSSLTPVDGRPALRSRKDSSSPGQGPVRFLQFPSSPSPPFRPPLATCWCRLSKQPAGAEGASCTRGTPAHPAAATAAKQQPPPPPKSLCGHPNVGKPKPPQRFE